MRTFKLKKSGRFLKTVGKQIVVGLTSISLIGLPACGTNLDVPKVVQKEKDYNYYFKVIVPEETERSMTSEKNDRIVAKIETMGRILSKQNDSMHRNIEDVTMHPASVASTVFVSQELRDTVDELSGDGVAIMFPFTELLLDHSDRVEGRNVAGVGDQGKARIFVYDGESSPRDDNAWEIQEFLIPIATSEKQSVVGEGALQQMTFTKNRAVVDDFSENLVRQVVANPSVIVERGEQPGFAVLKTSGSEMTVGLDGSVDDLTKDIRGKIKSISADVQSDEDESGGLQKSRKRRPWYQYVAIAVGVVVAALIIATIVVVIVTTGGKVPDGVVIHENRR